LNVVNLAAGGGWLYSLSRVLQQRVGTKVEIEKVSFCKDSKKVFGLISDSDMARKQG